MLGIVATSSAATPDAYAGTLDPQAPTAPATAEPAPAPAPTYTSAAGPARSDPNSGCTEEASQSMRRRPGQPSREQADVECDPNRLPTPSTVALPPPQPQDRWRIVDSLGLPATLLNPYASNNLLKGDRPLLDRPILGGNWFFAGTATASMLLESRHVPAASGQNMPFLDPRQQLFESGTVSVDTVLYRGDTIFQPPDYQFRFTPIFNYTVVRTNGQQVIARTIGAQALYFETHLRDVSANYDFDSLRVGIQPMDSDFRGFILSDQPVGVRLFGTRDNGIYQYNIGWFRPLPKNAARQNELGAGIPANDILLANLYVQDLGRPGLTSELLLIYDRNRIRGTRIVPHPGGLEATFIDGARHDYDVAYLGYSVDGHLGSLNLTASLYEALGVEKETEFGVRNTRVQASFAAAELSKDFDWTRIRASFLYASGDSDPFDRTARGFDGISQSALFAGADSTFFVHQQLPLALNHINLKLRDSLFPDLRSAAASGQSNYENPGLRLVGLGADFDLTPALRLSFDVNHLWFDQTATLAAVLGRSIPGRDIGTDASFDLFYRPLDSQNIILRLTGARLFAPSDTRMISGSDGAYSAFFNLILTY